MKKVNDVLSVRVAKKIAALFIDLDETLWEGTIVKEDRLSLHQDRYELINFMYDRGIQIFIVSQNDLSDVEKAFIRLGIDKSIFTQVIANWEPKVLNIKRLLQLTDIRPETAVFIDDNEALLREVSESISGIHVLSPEDLVKLKSLKIVSSRSKESSSDIRARQNRYRLKIKERSQIGLGFEVQKSLGKQICVAIPPARGLYRIIKLLFTTHRLNFNPDQFESEENLIESIFAKLNNGRVVYAVSAFQQEISLGLIGAFIVDIKGEIATVENATFSCSSMGLGFEEKAISVLIKKLKNQKVKKLLLMLNTSTTNSRIQKILWQLGFELQSQVVSTKGGTNCIFSLDIYCYETKNQLPWIIVSDKLNLDYPGMPDVIDFFKSEVVPLIDKGALITNLGSARGEVLGLLQESRRIKFEEMIKNAGATLSKVDLEYIPEEENIVGDAENLPDFFYDETQDHVWAFELLEHTFRPWKVLNEMMRICKISGYIVITVPGKSFPKHEYPVDLWRIGPEALLEIFSTDFFLPIAFKNIGPDNNLRRTMAVFKKIALTPKNFVKPFKADSFAGGSYNQNNGIIYFD